MILVTDIGNTNIIFSVVDENAGDALVYVERVITDKTLSVQEYAKLIGDAFAKHDVDMRALSGAVLSSSVPMITQIVKQAVRLNIGQDVLVVGPGIKVDIDLGHPNPSELGPDLLVGAVGGLTKYGAPLIIFDMGTCTTISVIDKNSRFLGGMIVPGVATSQNGMLARASHLPKAPLMKPDHLICGDTVEAIQSGLLYGHAAMADGMVDRIWEDLGYETKVVATGGLAPRVAPLCKKAIVQDDRLLMEGLLLLYRMNQ